MSRVGLIAGVVIALSGSFAPTARATGFTDIGQDIAEHSGTAVTVHGLLRLRGEALYNLDLDRGLTPSGDPIFPVPLSDPTSQWLTHADMRLRTDLAFYAASEPGLDAPGTGVAVKVRLDTLDNFALGSLPDGVPLATTSQRPPEDAIRIKRAYGEVLTPAGVLAAGRMGNHWGLGMLANGGDCADCDSGDAADRVAFLTPIADHIWAVGYDISATGPLTARENGQRAIDLDPADDVRSVTVALLRYRTPEAILRRRAADKITVDYGAYVAHRWQEQDVPVTYLTTATRVPITPAQSIYRGFSATAIDGWLRIVLPGGRIELEVAGIFGSIEQATLLPGALLRDPIDSRQLGAALETEVGTPGDRVAGGIDAGFASGDPAPAFGAFPRAGDAAPQPGDLHGPQAIAPFDAAVDNFRFHPDYRVDRILFRELIGTVTDAIYVRPHGRFRILEVGDGHLTAQLAAIGSLAVEPNSTPSGERGLGIEIDPTLVYQTRDGFQAAMEYAVLIPLSGFDNPETGATAKPAQLYRVRLGYAF